MRKINNSQLMEEKSFVMPEDATENIFSDELRKPQTKECKTQVSMQIDSIRARMDQNLLATLEHTGPHLSLVANGFSHNFRGGLGGTYVVGGNLVGTVEVKPKANLVVVKKP